NVPKIKISEEKITYPGIKQVYRIFDKDGLFKEDLLALKDEPEPMDSEDLLKQIMKNGELIRSLPHIEKIQGFYIENMKKLPNIYKSLEQIQTSRIKISEELDNLTNALKKKYQ
ncbi:unnamed protein product, partial [marine sediment metagenome]